jgi:SAM-dependent methyltransferase
MDERTVRALAEINRAFYGQYADDYSQTRGRPSRGWERVVARVQGERVSVLDIGCGNGRLFRYLASALGRPFDYVGVDASSELLAFASDAVGTQGRLIRHDFVAAPIDDVLPLEAGRGYSLVTLFNVLHHVPGRERRRALVHAAAERTAPGGVLAFTLWQFGNSARFENRILPWDDPSAPAVDTSELEPGDHLLRWSDRSVRYCHLIDAGEEAELALHPEFDLVENYDADGRTADLNRYVVLARN